MRVDQYLYNVRQFKSRNIASHACKNGHIQINDKNVKPSREIVPTDLIKIRKDQLWRTFEVFDIPKNRISAKLVAIYCIEKTDNSIIEIESLRKLSSNIFREQGKGRPTKKERREIDNIRFDKDLKD